MDIFVNKRSRNRKPGAISEGSLVLRRVLLLAAYGPDPLKALGAGTRKVTFWTHKHAKKPNSFNFRHVRVCRESERPGQRSSRGVHGPTPSPLIFD